jgi:pSer/pThr/pTyr-binding forkhead associated (FHA) protein
MQFLPGRLEVLQGRGVAEQEVRFVRPVNKAQAAEITFGRGEGPPFTHVQLRAPTVSRLHARLVQQAAGGWALENLSATNPVILNGEEIPVGAPPRPLHDGDRLEMGEVVFRYHAR